MELKAYRHIYRNLLHYILLKFKHSRTDFSETGKVHSFYFNIWLADNMLMLHRALLINIFPKKRASFIVLNTQSLTRKQTIKKMYIYIFLYIIVYFQEVNDMDFFLYFFLVIYKYIFQ